MAKELHIAISAEELFSVGSIEIANTLFTSFVVTAILVAFLFLANRHIKQHAADDKPTRFQSLLEMVVGGIYGLVESVTGPGKKLVTFAPIIGSFLIFIALNNWIALLPGVHTIKLTGEPTVKLSNVPAWMQPQDVYAAETTIEAAYSETETDHQEVAAAESGDEHAAENTDEKHHAVDLFRGANADLNMTLAVALISVGLTQIIGVQFAGFAYFKKFFNFSDPVSMFIGLLELVAEFSKIISFAFRLFGNIFAGEVLISVIKFLVPVLLPVPFMGFEIFVGGLQAYVFAMLSLVFFNMAASEHH